MRGDDKDHRSNDGAKDPEEGVDAVMEGSSVGIGFGRHGESATVICYRLSVI